MLLFPFPTCSSSKSCPLAEDVQQVNDLIFKKYWRSDPLDYQILGKGFWGKTGKKSDSTPPNYPPRRSLVQSDPPNYPSGRSLVQFDPQDYPSGQVGTLIWPPKLLFQGGRHPNLTPQIALPGRSIPQFDPQDYILDQVDTLIWPPKSYPRPGQESKTGVMFHSTASCDQILSPKFESLAE